MRRIAERASPAAAFQVRNRRRVSRIAESYLSGGAESRAELPRYGKATADSHQFREDHRRILCEGGVLRLASTAIGTPEGEAPIDHQCFKPRLGFKPRLAGQLSFQSALRRFGVGHKDRLRRVGVADPAVEDHGADEVVAIAEPGEQAVRQDVVNCGRIRMSRVARAKVHSDINGDPCFVPLQIYLAILGQKFR